jgi:acetyl-CoA carboxylase beta subunit
MSQTLTNPTCPDCGTPLLSRPRYEQVRIKGECGHHLSIGFERRIAILADQKSFRELDRDLVSGCPLTFLDAGPFGENLQAAESRTPA